MSYGTAKNSMQRFAWRSMAFKLIGTIAFIIVIVLFCVSKITSASSETTESIKIIKIDYSTSTITLQANDEDTILYYSNSSKKKWEAIPGEIGDDNTITMNFSWVSVSSNYEITFKGDYSTNIVSVKLPKQVTNFKAAFNIASGNMSFSNTSSRTIEWRKDNSTTWTVVNTDTFSDTLNYLYSNGATIYFRLAPENGLNGEVGNRASKEIAVKIPKKTTAPDVEINGSTLQLENLTSKMSYRYLVDDVAGEWQSIASTGTLELSSVAANVLYTSSNTDPESVTMQFITNATSSTQISNITTIEIPAQGAAPDADEYGIGLEYTSSSTLELTVESASSSVPFEYTIVEEDDVLKVSTAKWISITSSTAVSLDDDDAPDGSKIYIRKKSVNDMGDDDYAIASAITNLTGSSGITYPSSDTLNSLTTLITTAGICTTANTDGYLTFTMYSRYKTTVSAISFRNVYGITKGTVTTKSTVSTNKNASSDGSDAYIITTRITSTANLDSITDEVLYADITLSNSDKITSTKTTGVLLYLHPASVINNDIEDLDLSLDEDDFMTDFDRILDSNNTNDESKFYFKVDFGTENLIDTDNYSSYLSEDTAISEIQYDGYTLTQGDTGSTTADYTVEYTSYYSDEEERTIRAAIVCVYADRFEDNSIIDSYDSKVYFDITLNTGESFDSDISMELIRTAVIDDAPLAWSISEGSLEETTTITTTYSDGSTSESTEEVISYEITLTIFDDAYNVGISDVTWGGVSILRSAIAQNGTIIVDLSNPKINTLTTDSSTTNYLVFTLSNGYTITTGCIMTVIATQ